MTILTTTEEFESKILKTMSITYNKCFTKEEVFPLTEKLIFLSTLKNYQKLLKSFFLCNDKTNFNSLIFEINLAYEFASRGASLTYEVKKIQGSKSSMDFLWKLDDQIIYLELVRAHQQQYIVNTIERQLKERGFFGLSLGNDEIKKNLFRLQRILLSKCQNEKGERHKFPALSPTTHNIIVINVNENWLFPIDKTDCGQILYGEHFVAEEWHIGLFGLFENIKESYAFSGDFKFFRENISGILFVKSNSLDRGTITPCLEYLFIPNYQLCHKLNELNTWLKNLPSWTD